MEIDKNIVARLMAHKLGREPTPEELAEDDRRQEDAVNLASGVMGTVGGAANRFGKVKQMLGGVEAAAPAEMGMAEKIKQAAMQGKTQWKDLPQDAEKTMFQNRYKDAPSFFEKYGAKPKETPMSLDQERALFQQKLAEQADPGKSEALKNLLGKLK